MRTALVVLALLAANTLPAQILFDDFHYSKQQQMVKNGWIVRSAPGWPGVPGAKWQDRLMFLQEGTVRYVRMNAETDGTPENTVQAQICHQRKYLEGTYAARVRFIDHPLAGPDGDQIVETFYFISPLKEPMDLNYSEIDFEYLPNGGWGRQGPTMFATTWETFHPEPQWKADNDSHNVSGSHQGWHILLAQVGGGSVKYFIDGQPFIEHGGRVYPEELMSINFNLWFIRNGLLEKGELRKWQEDIDWVFFSKEQLSTEQVNEEIAKLRSKGTRFRDTVKAPEPPLPSPCDF
jgi:hypothetical protein